MNFFSIPAVSIAISIVICWALFAILCSLIHEAMAQIKAERGRFMKYYLLKQFQDLPNGINWGEAIYQQGNVSLLSRDERKPSNDIDPSIFAKAIIAAVANSHAVNARLQELEGFVNKGEKQTLPSEIVKKEARSTVLEEMKHFKNPVLYKFNAAVGLLLPSEQVSMFSSALSNAVSQASRTNNVINEQEVYQHLVEHLQSWYVELSQRLSLWYKKKTKARLFWLGAILALVLNVDSIQLFGLFNRNPAQRQAVMGFYQENQAYLEKLAKSIDSLGIKRDSLRTDSIGQQQQAGNISLDSLRKLAAVYTGKLDSLQKASDLPIGYRYSVFRNKLPPAGYFKYFLLKLIGILISGFAACFGAPFWFDLLRKAYSYK